MLLPVVRSALPGPIRCCCGLGRIVCPVSAAAGGYRCASTHQQPQHRKRRRGGRPSQQTGSTSCSSQLLPRLGARVRPGADEHFCGQTVERWTPERQGVVSMAPFVPTPSLGVAAALRLLAMSAQRGDVFVDLGCGDGRLVAAAYELTTEPAFQCATCRHRLRARTLNRGCFAVVTTIALQQCARMSHCNWRRTRPRSGGNSESGCVQGAERLDSSGRCGRAGLACAGCDPRLRIPLSGRKRDASTAAPARPGRWGPCGDL